MKLVWKYGLLKFVHDAIINADYITMNQWKKLIKNRILKDDTRKIMMNGMMCRSLCNVTEDTWRRNKMVSWWTYAKFNTWDINKCRIMIRLLLDSYRLNSKCCSICNNGQSSNATHILFQCNRFDNTRTQLWSDICNASPQRLGIELQNMNSDERCKFLLNALNCDFVRDWMELYKCVVKFVSTMYSAYMLAINS